jgi:hypothetical protein
VAIEEPKPKKPRTCFLSYVTRRNQEIARMLTMRYLGGEKWCLMYKESWWVRLLDCLEHDASIYNLHRVVTYFHILK